MVVTSGRACPMGEHEQAIKRSCEETVRRLAEALPRVEVGCVLRVGDVLRQVAHEGTLRVIYEFPRELGGVVWRAAERGTTQFVADVKADPDYLAADDAIRSEVAVPVAVGGRVVAVLNAEAADRVLMDGDKEIVEREAERLAGELEPFYAA